MVAQDRPESDIKKYLDEDPKKMQCQLCDNECHPGSKYQTFSISPSTCTNALLCDKVHIPNLELPKLDKNFTAIPGKTNDFHIHPEECCYGSHCGFRKGAAATVRYQKCGWDAAFKIMTRHKRTERDVTTGEEVKHCNHVCPDEYK